MWQRHWTPSVRDAVARPPAGLESLRVLLADVAPSRDGAMPVVTMSVDARSLAASGLPITLVVRIEGSRPIDDLALAAFAHEADELRARGVNVVGIEVDHDCATARLADYARWLARQRDALAKVAAGAAATPDARSGARSGARYRLSITALPTWASSSSLSDVARSVDEIVVQVHAVRAPMIFDANTAWRDLSRFARAVAAEGRMLHVALPTYSAVVRDVIVSVDPEDVARFVGKLRASPIDGVGGIVWFRLPVEGDDQTWSRATFARIVRGDLGTPAGIEATRRARATVALVARGDDRFDVVVSNSTSELVEMPPIRIAGDIGDADMVMGYRANGLGAWVAPRRSLARDERVVIGWIRGKDIAVVE